MWEHCLFAGWLGWSLLLHQDLHLGLLAKTLMLETFSEMKKTVDGDLAASPTDPATAFASYIVC